MGRRLKTLRCGVCLFVLALLPTILTAQGTVKGNRDLMRGIASGVADIIQKHFYDPALKGIDLKKELEAAQAKIAASNNVGEMYAAIDAMVQRMDDSHTHFMPPWQTQEPRFGFLAKPFGEVVRIYEIKKKSPGEKAGLKLGDTILGIDGIIADRKHYLQTLYYYRAIQPAGMMVLDLLRDGKRERVTMPAEIHTRFGIELVYDTYRYNDFLREAETFRQENPFEYAKKDDIGYVKVPSFGVDTAEKTLWKVKDVRALIVDLRGNLGGDEKVMQRFTGYFNQNEEEIFTEHARDKSEKLMAKPQKPSFSDVPVVVLVDSESASASEIFARHMQLTGRGIIIGDKTMGAVSGAELFVQHIGADPAVFYGAQTTVMHAIFPDGKDLEKVGVTPDTMCIPSAYALQQEKDPCLDLAMSTLKAKLVKGSSAPASQP
jgi:carboxyl-terminal processing protease